MSKYVSTFNVLGEDILIKDAETLEKLNSTISDLDNYEKKLSELVVLGDSYTQGYLSGGSYTSNSIPVILSKLLNLTLHNYGVNASGYTISGNTFLSQAEAAIADTSYDHTKVKYVVIIGGINDVNNNPSGDVSSASKTLQALLSINFTNAQIIIAPCWGAVSLPYNQEKIFKNICVVNTESERTVFLYKNITCLIGYPTLMGIDNIHPTEEGYNILAHNIYNMMKGQFVPRGKNATITSSNNWNIDNFNVVMNETSVRIYGSITAGQTITLSSLKICEISPDVTWAGTTMSTDYCSNGSTVTLLYTPPIPLTSAPNNGSISIVYDYGNTINSGDSIVLDITIPLLNY